MKKEFNKKINTGFTLIEILLYVSLFVIIVLGSVAFIHTMIETNIKTKTILEAENQADRAMSIITQQIRNSRSVISPNNQTISDTLVLEGQESATSTIIFSNIDNSIVIEEETGATTTLTSNKIIISDLNFKNLGNTNNKASIKISFKVKTQDPNERQEYNYEKTYERTASIRNE